MNNIIDKYVERYGKYYEGILSPESIEKSKAFWRKELSDFEREVREEEQQHVYKALKTAVVIESVRKLINNRPAYLWDEEAKNAAKEVGDIIRKSENHE